MKKDRSVTSKLWIWWMFKIRTRWLRKAAAQNHTKKINDLEGRMFPKSAIIWSMQLRPSSFF